MGNTGSCGEAGRVLTQGPPSESWGLYTHGRPAALYRGSTAVSSLAACSCSDRSPVAPPSPGQRLMESHQRRAGPCWNLSWVAELSSWWTAACAETKSVGV